MSQFFEGISRGLIILRIAIKLPELLIQNGQRPPPRRRRGRLSLDARHGVRQDADGIFKAPLRLVQHGLVVHYFQATRCVLPRLYEILFCLIEPVQFAVNLGDSQIHVRIVRHHVRKLLVHLQRFGIFLFGQQGLPQPALVAHLRRIEFSGLAVGLFRFLQLMSLGVGIAQKIQQHGCRRMCGNSLEQRDRLGGLALVHQQLCQLLDRRFVFRIVLQDAPQNLFGLVVFVLQPVKTRQPQCRLAIRRIEPVNLAVLLDGAVHRFRLAAAHTDVPQAPQIDPPQQPARLHVIRVAFQDFLRFGYGIVNPLGLPIHLRQPFADDLRLWIQGIRFLVRLDGLCGVFRVAARFVLLFVDVADREVVVGLGARGVFFESGGFRVGKLLLHRSRRIGHLFSPRVSGHLRHGSRAGGTRQQYGKGNPSKVHRSPRNLKYPMRPKRGQKPNRRRFQSLGAPGDWMQPSGETFSTGVGR